MGAIDSPEATNPKMITWMCIKNLETIRSRISARRLLLLKMLDAYLEGKKADKELSSKELRETRRITKAM